MRPSRVWRWANFAAVLKVREGHEEMDYRDHDSAGKGERVDKTTAMQNAKGALEEDERQSGRRTKHRTSEARAQVSS
jgi:hypothetical protein